MAREKRILVSFINRVGVMVDGRAIMIDCCICEDLFKMETVISKKPQVDESTAATIDAVRAMPHDFPLLLKVISLADGKPLKPSNSVMVKWNNLSAITEFLE